MLTGQFTVFGVVFGLLVAGFALLPTTLACIVAGLGMIVGGRFLLPQSTATGAGLIVGGVLLLIAGVFVHIRRVREEARAAEETVEAMRDKARLRVGARPDELE